MFSCNTPCCLVEHAAPSPFPFPTWEIPVAMSPCMFGRVDLHLIDSSKRLALRNRTQCLIRAALCVRTDGSRSRRFAIQIVWLCLATPPSRFDLVDSKSQPLLVLSQLPFLLLLPSPSNSEDRHIGRPASWSSTLLQLYIRNEPSLKRPSTTMPLRGYVPTAIPRLGLPRGRLITQVPPFP